MQDLLSFTHQSKKNVLSDLIGKNVTITYEGPDHPNAIIGSQSLTGSIISVGLMKFIFKPDSEEQEFPLTIDDVTGFEIVWLQKRVSRIG